MAKAFKGRWRISEMEVWDNDYLDLVEPAHIVFDSENDGAFVFGTVKGWLDVRYGLGQRKLMRNSVSPLGSHTSIP